MSDYALRKRRNAIISMIVFCLILIGIAVAPLFAHGSETRRLRKTTRITVLKPVRAQGRAAAGYPGLQTAANVTRIGVNLSGLINPIAWFF